MWNLVFIFVVHCSVISSKEIAVDGGMDEFNNFLKEAGSKLVVVDFYAPWCQPCRMMNSVLDQMSDDEFPDVVFLKVDIEQPGNSEIESEYGISDLPAFVFIKDSQKVTQVTGANPSVVQATIVANQ